MAWTSLDNSLSGKAEVLAGPILRNVTPKSVTLWIATKTGAAVTLTVWDDQNVMRMQGTRRTVAVGKNLHIVAVTATPLTGKPDLTEGVIYLYDLSFDFGSSTSNLKLATLNAALAYPPFDRPSFALPPQDLNSLRLLQGSCRMPHAEGMDAMPMIDELIAATASNPYARPHQLLLTGDQIYADDVSDMLLLLLSDAADVLLEWDEILPWIGTQPIAATDLPPPCRRAPVLTKAGLTSDSMQSHVISLGEYLCMYLFVWSDVLWPAPLPSVDDVIGAVFETPFHPKELDLIDASPERIKKQGLSVAEFAQKLPQVRRALANIPTYMIFDDHEVTDDWNTTRTWCRNVYGNPLALRVVQNALVAYALCQHWGNAPEQFESSKPGGGLLMQLDTPQPTQPTAFDRKALAYNETSAHIRTLLGVHDEAVLAQRPHNAVFHDDYSLQYHYTIEGPGHQVIVTDSRTWRSFPRGGMGPPILLPKDQLIRQIEQTTSPGTRALLVVLTTNAPPVQPIRVAARNPGIARHFKHHPDVYEAWDIPSVEFDHLLTTLTNRLPQVGGGARKGCVIFLSGDVHHSYASRLNYRANKRYGDASPGVKATAVIAQLVASSFKKQDEDTRGFQRSGPRRAGYTYAPVPARLMHLIPPHEPEGYAGWNVSVNSGLEVGEKTFFIHEDRINMELKLKQPTVPLQGEAERKVFIKLTETPDYVYRLDYLVPSAEGNAPTPPTIPSLPAGASAADRKQAAQAYKTAHAHYRRHVGSPGSARLIGVNNFGEITFDWGAGDNKSVNHTLRWRTYDSAQTPTWTTYRVSLDPNHLKDIPNYKGPTPP